MSARHCLDRASILSLFVLKHKIARPLPWTPRPCARVEIFGFDDSGRRIYITTLMQSAWGEASRRSEEHAHESQTRVRIPVPVLVRFARIVGMTLPGLAWNSGPDPCLRGPSKCRGEASRPLLASDAKCPIPTTRK